MGEDSPYVNDTVERRGSDMRDRSAKNKRNVGRVMDFRGEEKVK